MRPFVDSTDLVDDAAQLNRRMERDGYLFIRGLIPSEALRDVRIKLLQIATDGGWLKPHSTLEDGLVDPDAACADPEPEYLEVYRRLYVLEDLHEIPHHPALVRFFERMLGASVFPHPFLLLRNIFPQHPTFTTPAHQDFPHIQGTVETYTAWIPLSDCPIDMGGLQIATGSHKRGVLDFRPTDGAGGLEVTEDLVGLWVSSPFMLGDAVIFHSMAVHKGLPNTSPRLRQSLDVRYQRVGDPVADQNLDVYAKLFTWDEIYANWTSTELQYYWRKLPLKVLPWDPKYYERRDAMAFEMAAQGDRRARATLLRVIQRDTDPQKRRTAAALLAGLEGPT